MNNMNVKFYDGKQQDQNIIGEIKYQINQVIERNIFVDGPETRAFEEEWAIENGVQYCVLTANGTSALEIALNALEIRGQSIATTTNSFFATASCIATENYKEPFFIDTDETCNIDLNELEKAYNYKGVIGVNLYGNTLDHKRLQDICQNKKAKLILDLAQSHYSKYEGRNPAEFCDVGCFSFYTTKTLGCFGELGCIVTDNQDIMERAKCLRNHGREKEGYSHVVNSGNMRGDEIQAAIIRVKNKYKDYYINERLKIAARYKNNLKDVPYLELLKQNPYCTQLVNYVFPVFSWKRDDLKTFLKQNGIDTMIHYPYPLPALKVYQGKYAEGVYDNARKQCDKQLSLPFYAGLSNDSIDYVSEKVINFFQKV